MSKELSKTYDPKAIEDRLYKHWEEKGYFHAEVDPKKKPFTIMMPPPNITGQLHMGHALDNTMQDILARYRRMEGYNVLWQPGTDHASIATEVKVTKALKEEGVDKHDLGREGFIKKCWEWRDQYGRRITKQLRKLGSSADWSRERFTMDEGCSRAVRKVFVDLYHKGLIYKGKKIINWCPVCHTSISDAEVEYKEQASHFWHIKYPLINADGSVSTTEFLEFATTRPETMLGDTAVAVNPEDDRYKALIGQKVMLPIMNRPIPIVGDEHADMTEGTGVVKITPAHDPNDFEVGLRHDLPVINILNDDATINENGGKYAGMDRYEARDAIVKELREMGLLVSIEDLTHNVGTHDRCGTTVEPMVKEQWFVKMDDLIKPAISAVKKGEIKLIPKGLEGTYFNWTNNIRDWCISRQLWWGHRIPAWTCSDCGEMTVDVEEPKACPKCGSHHLVQDPDTLDTWFSSALWPFSTLGWPDKTKELSYFYPTDVLVTGYDIIFFWVIRMIFSGYAQMGEAPFHTVLFHGLVRDEKGRKMSKSLGNGIDPLEVIDKYGADALRLTLITGNAPGHDMRFYWERVEASRNFANKVWNASRFILMNLEGFDGKRPDDTAFETVDRWIISRANTAAKEVTENLDHFELGIAADKIHDFIWEEFCDWYIESVKPRIWKKDSDDPKDKSSRQAALWTLKDTLSKALKLLHPYMPFITDEIYTSLNPDEDSVMVSPWPVYDESLSDPKAEEVMKRVMDLVRGLRDARTRMDVPPSRKAEVTIVSDQEKVRDLYEENIEAYRLLAMADKVFVRADRAGIPDNAVSVVIPDAVAYMPLSDLVDIDQEKKRLTGEKKKLEGELKRSHGILSNEKFLAKAPEAKVAEEKEKLKKYEQMMEEVEKRLSEF